MMSQAEASSDFKSIQHQKNNLKNPNVNNARNAPDFNFNSEYL